MNKKYADGINEVEGLRIVRSWCVQMSGKDQNVISLFLSWGKPYHKSWALKSDNHFHLSLTTTLPPAVCFTRLWHAMVNSLHHSCPSYSAVLRPSPHSGVELFSPDGLHPSSQASNRALICHNNKICLLPFSFIKLSISVLMSLGWWKHSSKIIACLSPVLKGFFFFNHHWVGHMFLHLSVLLFQLQYLHSQERNQCLEM